MKRLPQRAAVAASAFFPCLLFLCPAAVRAETPWAQSPPTRSASGQFIVTETPPPHSFFRRPEMPTNRVMLRLQAPWVTVSAERFKSALWREIGLSSSTPWNGKIFIVLRPARTLNDPAVITPQPFIRVWNCRLELPDLISRDRYARALSGVLLLEIANRHTPVNDRPAGPPAWLVDGLARQIAESEEVQAILSAPTKSVSGTAVVSSGPVSVPGGLPQTRVDEKRRGLDSLASARRVLQSAPALTFEQLNWPGDAEMNGADGGVYLASAQLFVDSLLHLKQGPEKIRALLAALPECENWQSAFFKAFREDFRGPLDVEKWWALRVTAFAARSPGPQWTPAVSREKLAEALFVPVAIRQATNDLPVRTVVTLQVAIQSLEPAPQAEALRVRLRDLELVQFRLTPRLAAVAAGYRAVLADYLGEPPGKSVTRPGAKRKVIRHSSSSVAATVKKLDALDAQRRDIEAELERRATPVRADEAKPARLTGREPDL
jgi:hypothetical protein